MSGPATSPPSMSDHLQTLTESLAAAHTRDEVFGIVLTPALQALAAVAGAVLLVSEDGGRLEMAATQGYEPEAQTLWQDGPLDGHVPAGDALERHAALFFEQQGDLTRAYPELEARTGGVAAVATAVLPMFLDGQALGVVILDFQEPHHFTPEEQRFLRTLAAQCAVALGRVRSVEAQARSLRAWQASHERLVLTLHAGGFGLWELEVGSGMLSRSPETMRLLGLPTPVGPLSEYLERIHPEDRPDVERAFARAGQDGTPHFVVRHRFDRGDGREVWLEQHTQVERDGAGHAVRFVGVTADITERHRAERQVQASEARFRRMVEASPVAIAAGDRAGRLMLVNDAYLDLLGFTRAEFEAGRIDWASLTPPEYHGADERAFGQALGHGASDAYDKEMWTKTGERLPLSVVLIRYEDGEQALVVGYLRDLRVQQAAERVLREHSAELERQVAARTRESEAARRRAEVLAALGDALQAVTTPEQVAALALDPLGPALRAESMLLIRLDGEQLRPPTVWGDAPEVIVAFMSRPGLRLSETPNLQRIAREGRGVYLDDYRLASDALAPFPSLAGAAEPISQPDGTLEGFLVVWRGTDLGPWEDAERDLLRRAAGTLGLALERAATAAQLTARRQQLEEKVRAQEAFVAFTEAVGTETNVVALAQRAVDVLQAHFAGGTGGYYEREGELWRLRSWTRDLDAQPEFVAALCAGLPGETPFITDLLRERAPVFTEHWDAGHERIEDSGDYGTVAAYPVILGGEVRGFFTMGFKHLSRWAERDRAIFRSVGHSLTLALDRAEQAQRLAVQNTELDARTRALEGFAHLTQDLATQGDPRAFVRRAQEVVMTLLPPGYALYYEREEGRWRNQVQVGDTGNAELQAFIDAGPPVGMTPSVDVPWTTRRPLYQDSYARGSDTPADMVGHVSAAASLPVLRRGEVVGVFIAVLFEPRKWAPTDKVVLETVVGSLSLALERAEGVADLARRTEELARSNAELEQFAYIASHDLQAPIRAVTSFAGVIDKRYGSALDDRGRLYLRQIVESGEHMKRLVDDLLTFSRVHTGRRSLLPVDAGAVFDAVLRRLHPEIEASRATVTRGELPVVLADAQQLDQLLQNLISNGLKYHREGVAPHVHVSAQQDGEMWRFAVSDNGIGIEGQYFERIFVIFQRLHGREEYEGTGIGLAVCKKIVERHGGRLWLNSTPGQGSTFLFTLPEG